MNDNNHFNILFFLLGILYLFILPPFTAPDEAGHFATAYHYVNVLYGVTDSVVESTAGNVYREIVMREQDAELYAKLPSGSERKIYSVLADSTRRVSALYVEDILVTKCTCRTMPYIFPLYMPAMVAILLCRFMRLSSVVMVYLARLMTFLTSWFIICKAIKRLPVCKNIFKAIVLFPMTLHLISSCSADAIGIASAVYCSAIILCYRKYPIKMRISDCMFFAVAWNIVILSKPIYVLLFVLSFLMPLEVFVRKKYYYIFCLMPLLFWIWKYSPIVFSCFFEGDVSTYANSLQGYSVGYILKNPIEIISLIIYSIWKELPYICVQVIGLYLGPLIIRVPSVALIIFGGLLIFAVADAKDGQPKLNKKARIGVVLIFILTYICCYCMQLLWWTPFGADTIEGMQGRYLLPLFGLLCVSLKPGKPVKWMGSINMDFILPIGAAMTNIYVLISVFNQLI